jgi:CarD family transcriptional regulator
MQGATLSMPDTSFNVGDKVVYPRYGVSEVVGLEQLDISGHSVDVYVLRVLENNVSVRVPRHKADSVGLRRLVDEREVSQVYETLRRRGEKISTATWNRRHREYMEKINTGSLIEIASVLRDLSLLRSNKELSFGERRMLEMARQLLVQELALAKGQEEDAVATELDELFA